MSSSFVLSIASCLLNSFCSLVSGPWLLVALGEFEGGADRDETELSCAISFIPMPSCRGADATAELGVAVDASLSASELVAIEHLCWARHSLFAVDARAG